MKRMMQAALGIGFLAMALSAGRASAGEPPAEEFSDTAHVNENSTPNIKVIEDSWKGVTIQHGSGPQPFFSIDNVQGIDYGERASEYETALEAKRAGKYDKAAKSFEAGLRKTKAKDKVQHQYFLMGMIECYDLAGNAEEMRKAVKAMVKIDPAPRLIYEAYPKLGESYFRAGDFENALKAYQEAQKFFEARADEAQKLILGGVVKKNQLTKTTCQLWTIRCKESLGRIDDARNEYENLIIRGDRYPNLADQAKIGIGRCLAADAAKKEKPTDQDWARATKHLEKLLDPKNKEGVQPSAMPAVYLALGDIYFNKLDYPQARWYYLKVTVQYAADRAVLARAHFQAGRCYEALKKDERSTWFKGALRHYKIVEKEFEDSLEHSQAKERLEELGV